MTRRLRNRRTWLVCKPKSCLVLLQPSTESDQSDCSPVYVWTYIHNMHLHACSAYQHVGAPCGDDGEASIWLGCNFKLQQNKTWYGLAMYLTSPNYAHKISIHKLKHQFPTTEATFFDRASFYSDQYNTVTHIDLQYTEINTQWFNTQWSIQYCDTHRSTIHRDQYTVIQYTYTHTHNTQFNIQWSIQSEQYTVINTYNTVYTCTYKLCTCLAQCRDNMLLPKFRLAKDLHIESSNTQRENTILRTQQLKCYDSQYCIYKHDCWFRPLVWISVWHQKIIGKSGNGPHCRSSPFDKHYRSKII